MIDKAAPAIAQGCERYKVRPGDLEVEGDVAGITCPVDDPDVTEALYFRFASSDLMATLWQQRLGTAKVQPDSAGCAGGGRGETSYDGGRLLCYLADGEGRLRWIDEGALIYGVVNGRTPRLAAMLEWWLESHAARGVQALTAIEQGLVADAPPDIANTCIPYRTVAPGETAVEGSVGAIDCLIDSNLVEDVGYFKFPTSNTLQGWWRDRIANQKIELDSGGCFDGTTGETNTGIGRIACYVSGGNARVRWTDDTRLVYGALNGVTDNLASLFKWWDVRH